VIDPDQNQRWAEESEKARAQCAKVGHDRRPTDGYCLRCGNVELRKRPIETGAALGTATPPIGGLGDYIPDAALSSAARALATYRDAHAALHILWTDAVGTPGYDKRMWTRLSNAIDKMGRDAATAAGVPKTEPLIR
jgi:hypothetical protein